MTKIYGPFRYSDNDRTLRQTADDGSEATVTAPEGFVIRFYAHDERNMFWYFSPEEAF